MADDGDHWTKRQNYIKIFKRRGKRFASRALETIAVGGIFSQLVVFPAGIDRPILALPATPASGLAGLGNSLLLLNLPNGGTIPNEESPRPLWFEGWNQEQRKPWGCLSGVGA